MTTISKLVHAEPLREEQCEAVFNEIYLLLIKRRQNVVEWVGIATPLRTEELEVKATNQAFIAEFDKWANSLLQGVWAACERPGEACPLINNEAESLTRMVNHDTLPPPGACTKIANTILFLDITIRKEYSALTRSFLLSYATIDEEAVANTLKNPKHAMEEVQKQTTDVMKKSADSNKIWRTLGLGVGAVAGGVLVGVSGGLAAPLVGAGMSTMLAWLGVGSTAAGLLATGLASSSVVCGTLFGAYGAKASAEMVDRHTRDIQGFALDPLRPVRHTLAIRICVSGWVETEDDFKNPWNVFDDRGVDTFILKWELEALQTLSSALRSFAKSKAMGMLKRKIIERTAFAALYSCLSPSAWIQLGQIVDNPWSNARALSIKAGRILGELLAGRVLGNRPVTLVGYSLGALVIFEALKHLATLEPSAIGLVEDVFLFGTPAPADQEEWKGVRRVVAGRLINGYSSGDYILYTLEKIWSVDWNVAGLTAVDVPGVENLQCADVGGHLKWREAISRSLRQCGAPGVTNEGTGV